MRHLHRKQIPRAAATALILAAQFQLLWLGAVHCHELPLVPHSAMLQSAGQAQQAPSAGADVLCSTCNLIHQSTARGTATFSAQQPTVSARYPLATLHVSTRTYDLPVLRGRAPPLS